MFISFVFLLLFFCCHYHNHNVTANNETNNSHHVVKRLGLILFPIPGLPNKTKCYCPFCTLDMCKGETFDYGCWEHEVMPSRQCTGRMRRTPEPGHLLSDTCCNDTDYCNRNLTSRHMEYIKQLRLHFSPNQTSQLLLSLSLVSSVGFHSFSVAEPSQFILPTTVSLSPSSVYYTKSANKFGNYFWYIVISFCLLFIILFITIVTVGLILCVKIMSKKRKKKLDIPEESGIMNSQVPIFNSLHSTSNSGSGVGTGTLKQRRLDKIFVLSREIGRGHFGRVFIGEYNEEQYAVKRFFTSAMEMYDNELKIYFKYNLRHNNILLSIAMDYVNYNEMTEVWLITQYHQRGSLSEEIERNALSLDESFKILISACSGLVYLHGSFVGVHGKPSMAHRDIKPGNILMKDDGTCCLADFGLTLVQGSEFFKNVKVTQGTKRYMSPEILSETIETDDIMYFLLSDVYSFSLVIWEVFMRTKIDNEEEPPHELPFSSEVPLQPSFEAMRIAIIDNEVTPRLPLKWKEEHLLCHFTEVLSDCWNHCPRKRPNSYIIKNFLISLCTQWK